MFKFSQIKGFNWNEANVAKNWLKHKVTCRECEEVFFDKKSRIFKDKIHSEKEQRFIIIGKTKKQRLLFVVFTVRKYNIRVISARDLKKKKELKLYS